MRGSAKPNALSWLAVSVLVLLLDQLSKLWVLRSLPEFEPVTVIEGAWNWYRTYNTGAAFSLLGDAGGWQQYLFSGFAVVISLVLAWWLVSVSNGPEGFDSFHAISDSPPGLVILFGLAWALSFHFLSGVRHLAWDLGYGYGKDDSRRLSVAIIALSLVFAFAIFALVWTGHGGYLQ